MLQRAKKIWQRLLHGAPDEVLDHVQVTIKASDKWRRKKLAEAAARHGKTFKCAGSGLHCEVIHRVTPHSDVLEKIELASRQKNPSDVVRQMKKVITK